MGRPRKTDLLTCAYCFEGGSLVQFWDKNLKDFDYAHAKCRPDPMEATKRIRELLAPMTPGPTGHLDP